ncbi:hypothetical protein [Alicyclobacillus sendaiensis]|uniref:hypothetical protein n=1 Tax=Alicyclobacillus sendaiensis TaxID=192387 RepID=UPI0026F4444B|nr:hypothetical protein [Alicyclobacillus sendaiensis]
MGKETRETVKIKDNVTVTLTDVVTGKTRTFSAHNVALNWHFEVLSMWIAGVNNTGYNAVPPPSQIQYGNGTGTPSPTDTGCFSPIPNSITNLSYAQPNTPQNGTTTLVFQTPPGVITTTITEAFLRDTSGRGFAHTMFGAPFTPTSNEMITTKWEITYSN